MSDAPGLSNFKRSIVILPEEEKTFIKDESKHGRFLYADQVYDVATTLDKQDNPHPEPR